MLKHEAEQEYQELQAHLQNLQDDIVRETDYGTRTDLERAWNATYERIVELEETALKDAPPMATHSSAT